MAIGIIGVATATALANINLVIEAMGRGPGSITRKATNVPNPAWTAPATHYYMSDQSATPELQAQFLGFANGDLPPLPEGVVWGVNGVISAADALAAITAENFAFAAFNEGFEPSEQVEAALTALGLYAVPEEPV